MKKNNTFSKLERVLAPVLLILLGAVLTFSPDYASAMIAKILAWVFLAVGIGYVIASLTSRGSVAGKVIFALFFLAIGGWLLKNPLLLAAGIGRFVGIVLVIRSARDVFDSNYRGGKVLSLAALAVGVVLIVLPMTTSRLVLSLCGIVVLIIGIAMLFDRLRGRRRLNPPEDPDIIDAL